MAGVAGRQGVVFMDRTMSDMDVDVSPDQADGELSLQPPPSPGSSDSERSYAEIYSDESYHSDGSEIADTWDPYCE